MRNQNSSFLSIGYQNLGRKKAKLIDMSRIPMRASMIRKPILNPTETQFLPGDEN